MCNTLNWQYPNPFTQRWTIHPDNIDRYQHVNNVAYLAQQELIAWAHANALGLTFSDYQALDRGMVIMRHELNYLKPIVLGDQIIAGTWITRCDGKVSLTREFEFINQTTRQVVFRGKTQFACIKLSTGKPTRMPSEFIRIYSAASIEQGA